MIWFRDSDGGAAYGRFIKVLLEADLAKINETMTEMADAMFSILGSICIGIDGGSCGSL